MQFIDSEIQKFLNEFQTKIVGRITYSLIFILKTARKIIEGKHERMRMENKFKSFIMHSLIISI
jgi:hypothetical protein